MPPREIKAQDSDVDDEAIAVLAHMQQDTETYYESNPIDASEVESELEASVDTREQSEGIPDALDTETRRLQRRFGAGAVAQSESDGDDLESSDDEKMYKVAKSDKSTQEDDRMSQAEEIGKFFYLILV
jgi:hypothetical protein